jgi:hypothetical protein
MRPQVVRSVRGIAAIRTGKASALVLSSHVVVQRGLALSLVGALLALKSCSRVLGSHVAFQIIFAGTYERAARAGVAAALVFHLDVMRQTLLGPVS